MQGEMILTIGPLAVRTGPSAVKAFAEALGSSFAEGGSARVPHTFPMSWLDLDEVKTALFERSGQVLQTLQTIVYRRPLLIDKDYSMTVRLVKERTARSLLDTTVIDSTGALVVSMASHVVTLPRSENAAP